MPSLDQRFASLTRSRVPDLWPDIEHRDPRPEEGPSGARRLAAGVMAGLIGVGGVGLAIRALSPGDAVPAGAPAEGLLAFASDRGGGWAIYTAPPALERDTHPVPGTSGAYGPAWSPDGDRIAYVGGADADVFTIGVEGADPERLTDDPEADWDPSWSPDGRRIAFASFRDGDADLYVMGADGRNVVRLTDGPERDEAPDWSPDGTRIAFQRDGAVYVVDAVDADGSEPREIAPRGGSPAWSPDARRIAFVGTSTNGPLGDIYVMNADGSDVARLTDAPSADYAPAWSPDGLRIAFVSVRDGNDEIYVMNADGTDQTNLTSHEANDGAPSWEQVPVDASPAPEGSLEPPPSELSDAEPALVARIDVGPFPNAVAVGSDAAWVSVPDNDGTFGGEIVRLAAGSGEIAQRIRVPALPTWEVGGGGLTVFDGSVWALGNGNLTDDRSAQHGPILVRVDEGSGEVVDAVALHGESAGDIVVDDAGIWALVFATGDTMEVLRLDRVTLDIVARIPVEGIWGQKITSRGGAVWVETNEPYPDSDDTVGGSLLSKIDPVSNEVTWTMRGTGFVESFAVDDPALWALTGHRTASLVRIDPRTNEILSETEVEPNLDPIAIDREGGYWSSGWTEGSGRTIQRLDPVEGDVVASVEVGGGENRWYVVASAYDPARDSIWVAHYEDVVSWVDAG
jgi:Tol biopolymer transport system component